MTRSFLLHRRVPVLLLGLLLLAAAGCGGGADDATADTLAHGPVADAPAGPDVSVSTSAVTGVSAPTSTVAGRSTTAPPTSARSTTVSTAATGSTPSTGSTTTATTATTATTGRPAGGRLAGTVTASPTCPVERPDQPCPPRPVAAHVEVFDRSEQLVASTDAGAEGRFTLTLAPGRYMLTASSGTVFPSCPSLTVEVPAGGEARADIACDTGIR